MSIDVLELGLDHEAKEFSINILEFQLSYPLARMEDNNALSRVFRVIEFANSSLSQNFIELRSRRTSFVWSPGWTESTFHLNFNRNFISSFSVHNGSIKVRAKVAVKVIAVAYTATAMYPDFKQGVVQVYDEAANVLEMVFNNGGVLSRSSDQIHGWWYKASDDLNSRELPDDSLEYSIQGIRQKTILEQLDAELKANFRYK